MSNDQIAGLDELNTQAKAETNGHVEAEDGAVSLDTLHGIEVDNAVVDDTLRRGLMPSGTYQTNPGEFGDMNVLAQQMEEKDDAGTVISKRLVITLTGRGTAKVKLGNEIKLVEGRLRVQLSPEVRRKRNFATGEELDSNDSKSNLYAQAVKAYEQQFGERATNLQQVVDYLSTYPVRYRMIQIGVPTPNNPSPDGEPRNFVIALYAVKAR